ncbi:MAG: hypothetical protein WBG92_13340 [Thiohalocapsa sp.]
MSERLRKLAGILLILAAIGVASWQTLLVSCSSSAATGSAHQAVAAPH